MQLIHYISSGQTDKLRTLLSTGPQEVNQAFIELLPTLPDETVLSLSEELLTGAPVNLHVAVALLAGINKLMEANPLKVELVGPVVARMIFDNIWDQTEADSRIIAQFLLEKCTSLRFLAEFAKDSGKPDVAFNLYRELFKTERFTLQNANLFSPTVVDAINNFIIDNSNPVANYLFELENQIYANNVDSNTLRESLRDAFDDIAENCSAILAYIDDLDGYKIAKLVILRVLGKVHFMRGAPQEGCFYYQRAVETAKLTDRKVFLATLRDYLKVLSINKNLAPQDAVLEALKLYLREEEDRVENHEIIKGVLSWLVRTMRVTNFTDLLALDDETRTKVLHYIATFYAPDASDDE